MLTGRSMRQHRRDIAAAEQDTALGIGRLEAGQHAQQRGLAAAAGTQQRKELAGLDVERKAVDGNEAAEPLDHCGNAQQRVPAPASPSCGCPVLSHRPRRGITGHPCPRCSRTAPALSIARGRGQAQPRAPPDEPSSANPRPLLPDQIAHFFADRSSPQRSGRDRPERARRQADFSIGCRRPPPATERRLAQEGPSLPAARIKPPTSAAGNVAAGKRRLRGSREAGTGEKAAKTAIPASALACGRVTVPPEYSQQRRLFTPCVADRQPRHLGRAKPSPATTYTPVPAHGGRTTAIAAEGCGVGDIEQIGHIPRRCRHGAHDRPQNPAPWHRSV